MNAIQQLREWFTQDKRPEVSAWITGDTVETRAILELADRLEKVEQDCGRMAALRRYKFDPNLPPITPLPVPNATESPPEPFRISGAGKYQTRNDRFAFITHNDGSDEDCWPWIGTVDGVDESWSTDGTVLGRGNLQPRDIVVGPIADDPQQEPEMAGLRGLMRFTAGQEPRLLSPTYMVDRVEVDIDLSKVPASAIVKPEPKRETRKVWLNLYEQSCYVFYDRKTADSTASDARLACIETEITFSHGEGLEGRK